MTVAVTRGDTGEGVVEEVRQLMGPADVELARENSPERFACASMMKTKTL